MTGCIKQQPMSQQYLWTKDEIVLALNALSAGEAALAVIPTLQGESLKSALEESENANVQNSLIKDTKTITLSFVDGRIRKASLAADNKEAATATAGQLLIRWPNTCLLVACWLGHFELVKALLKRGIPVDCRDTDGRTPLHLAACSGSAKVVEELLKYGPNPNEWDFDRTCTSLHCAAAAGDINAVKALLRSGADVNAGLLNKSPLHYAVLSNAADCVETLLQAGASPNNPQVYTETPLHVAASLGSSSCIKLLLSYGADVRVQHGASRTTPLHLAAEEGSPECTKLLLDAGAPWDARNSRGQTAMHLAALAQSTESLEALVKAGANVNIEDDDGRTPLHAAVAKALRGTELVRILIQAGAYINKPDKFGYTALHIAALNECSQLVVLLLGKGADITARTKGGISALSFIVRRTPDVLPRFTARLDQAVSLHDHELGDVDCELRLDFRPLVPGGRGETDLMLCLVEVGQKHILRHPLCESFLYLKWLRIRKFFLMSLVFHSIFVAIFTAYIVVTFLWNNQKLGGILLWAVLSFTCILACKEIFQLAHGVWSYAKRWENWLQWGVVISSGVILIKPVNNWQHHVAALGILLAWMELMMVVGRFPMFGIYVQMFTQVAVNFFKFLGAYICLIIGFSLGFSVLHMNYKSFMNPLVGLLKTIIMMSGELEFEDVFFDEEAHVLYPGTAHLMLLSFVILVTIILTNLMVGLAVSDIQELRRCAGLDRLVRRAELVAHLESMLFSKLLDRAPDKLVKTFRKGALLLRPPHHCAIHIHPNDPREKRLPKELIKAIYRLVAEKKINKRTTRNISTHSVKDTDIGDTRLSRLYSTTSTNEVTKQQLNELLTEIKRFSYNINSRLDNLTSKIEAIAQEIDGSILS
ncbi:transient receptor potential channel pyrexia [Orussus abietinus]|uniref:transient receptor potential channel pyrexia n=1 Tax=Orussus abietinus TaxID=222816 RepID=UPI000C715E8B|nr:transient receptor potential channel pyrexia [Orussus abietinus]